MKTLKTTKPAKRRERRPEGNIKPRKDGRFEVRVTLPEGGGIKSYYTKTETEAEKKLRDVLHQLDLGAQLARDERLTVERFLNDWLERKRVDLRPRTWIRYRELLQHVVRTMGKRALTKVTASHVDHLYSALQRPADDANVEALSSTTVHHLHVTLRQAFDDAERLGYVARNVVDLVRSPRMRQVEMHTLDLEQSRTLLAAARGERLEALYVLALTTGMREGELLALRWRDVDLDGASLQVRGTLAYLKGEGWHIGQPKTARSRRRIDLSNEVVMALRRHKLRQAEERKAAGDVWGHGVACADLVFCNEIGGPIDGRNLRQRSFRRALTQANLPAIRFHDLRHTAATLMLLQGIHPKVVSERLGHSSVALTLDRYSHVLPSMQKSAAEEMDKALFV